MVRIAFYFYSLFFLLALGITAVFGSWKHWFPQKSGTDWGIDLALAVGTAALFVLLSRVFSSRIQAFQRVTDDFQRFFKGATSRDVWLLALFSGIAEEALFRVALQPLIGLLGASLIFGLLHIKAETPESSPPPAEDTPSHPGEIPTVSTQQTFEGEESKPAQADVQAVQDNIPPARPARPRLLWAWTLFALVFGLAIGALFEWRQGLFLPALTHVLINGFNMSWLSRES